MQSKKRARPIAARLKMWRVFDQPIGTFVYFFVRFENFALYHDKKKSVFAQILGVALL